MSASPPHSTGTPDAMEQLFKQLNGGLFEPALVEQTVQEEHRYLQQKYWDEVVIPSIIALSQCHTDARNRRAVKQAEEIVEAMDWEYRLE